jgi:hypothetical protein
MYKSKFLESISIDQNVLADFPKEQTIEFDNLQSELLEDSRLAARQALFPDPQISEMEIEVLRQILKQTLVQGSYLHACRDEEQANCFRIYLMSHLPPEFAALVIRGSEVNTFKEATKTPKTIMKGGNGKHTLT